MDIPISGRVVVSWSGGKDSALALQKVLADDQYHLTGLLTTITEEFERISMHGVRIELLEQQAERMGVAVQQVRVPPKSSNAEYEAKMEQVLRKFQDLGVEGVVFGDIFLEELREYRETKLRQLGLHGIFPLWREDTLVLAEHFIEQGFRAVVTCVDGEVLSKEFVGREYDKEFIATLPEGVDPCGENGEFHTFVYGGPIFKSKIELMQGEKVLREARFWYCDYQLV